MKTFKNQTGSKAVNISVDANGNINAFYVQIYNNEQQVLQSKRFASVKTAENWALKILN
jgi:hypothetical protein